MSGDGVGVGRGRAMGSEVQVEQGNFELVWGRQY